jgi:fructokinase
MTLFGGIEAGGTKFVCAIGTGPDDLRATVRIPTTTPSETLERVVAFFARHPEPLDGLGVGAFGPLDLDPRSPTHGHITSTPKPGWRQCDIAGTLRRALGTPVAIDTDVNVAALGEHRWGAAQDVDDVLYMTVGTGIGGGVLVHGEPVHGLLHPEIGHIPVAHDRQADSFPGICPFHGDCLEGLASGPSIHARWGQPGETLPDDHPAWALEAQYIALALATCIYTLSSQRIILGGGVMQRRQLFPLIRSRVRALLGGYLDVPAIRQHVGDYIVSPALGGNAGVLGALALAQEKAVTMASAR